MGDDLLLIRMGPGAEWVSLKTRDFTFENVTSLPDKKLVKVKFGSEMM